MKAIRTRYYGPTNTKGSRIVASDGDGNSTSIGYPHSFNSDEAHELAAYLLMEKMQWTNQIIGGGFQRDMYWTMIPRERGDKAGYTLFLSRPDIASKRAA